MKNIFTRYQFGIIFCFTLCLFSFLFFGLTNETLALGPTSDALSQPPVGAGTQDAGEEIGIFESTFNEIIYRISSAIGMTVISIGGLLLDASIHYGILQMGSILSPTSALGIGVLEIWGVVRDILNILFIFGLIYVGISTILDSHKSETQRTLGYIIVAALLINFSLYATQVFIDFTNILAIQVHNQIIGTQGSLAQGFSSTVVPLDANSISGAFLNVAGVTSFLGGDGSGVIDKLTFGKVFFYSIFMMVFLIVAGIVFALGAVLLITRFAALVLFMIFSPLMFAGWIFPAFGSKAEEFWSWDKLIKQALFAPAFLFMLYLSLIVLQSLQGIISPKSDQFSNMIISGASAVDTFSMVMFFALMIVFLFASIKIATSMGVVGAETAYGALSEARGMAQGFMYRNTAGRGLNAVVNQIDRANRNEGKGNVFSRMGNYGLRIATGGEDGREAFKKASNVGMGGAGREHVKHAEHERKQRAARGIQIHDIDHGLESDDSIVREKAMRDASPVQLIEMIEHHHEKNIINNAGLLSDSQMAAIMKDDKIDDATKGKIAAKRGSQTKDRLIASNTPAGGTAPAFNTVIGKADASDLKAMGFDIAKTNAGYLTAKQIDDWKDLTPTEKSQIKAERKSQLESEFNQNGPGAGAGTLFGRIKSDEEKSKLPDSVLVHPSSAQYLNTNVLAKIVDNNGISDQQRTDIKRYVMGQFPAGATAANNPQFKKYEDFFDKNNAGQRY